MKVLFLTQTGEVGASARYRVYRYLDFLRANGVASTVVPAVSDELAAAYAAEPGREKRRYYASILARRLRDLLHVRRYDVVFLQRDVLVHAYPAIEMAMAQLNSRIVLDLDDATWEVPTGKRPGTLIGLLRDPQKIRRIASRAACVIAGNAEIAAHVADVARRVEVIPTSIPLEDYGSEPRVWGQSGVPRIGWIGSQGTIPYLRLVLPALEQAAKRGAFVLRVVGGTVENGHGFPVECAPWRRETEIEELSRFDIGVMPLADDAWSRGKSATKLLQYMAAGVAAVASPVGVNAEIVVDGVNGFVASNEANWTDRLARLVADPALRHQLGAAGRRTVVEKYSTAVSGPKLLAVLRRVGGEQ